MSLCPLQGDDSVAPSPPKVSFATSHFSEQHSKKSDATNGPMTELRDHENFGKILTDRPVQVWMDTPQLQAVFALRT